MVSWKLLVPSLIAAAAAQSDIVFPAEFTPGTTDNFVSNEVIAANITAAQIWSFLDDVSKWESYYWNCQNISAPASGSTWLKQGDVFKFATFGFPQLTCPVEVSVAPGNGTAGQLAWRSEPDSDGDVIYHGFLVEDLPDQRVRILTQESQIGAVFAEWAVAKPNKMLLGHQDWLDGLVLAAQGKPVYRNNTNLYSIGFTQRNETELQAAGIEEKEEGL